MIYWSWVYMIFILFFIKTKKFLISWMYYFFFFQIQVLKHIVFTSAYNHIWNHEKRWCRYIYLWLNWISKNDEMKKEHVVESKITDRARWCLPGCNGGIQKSARNPGGIHPFSGQYTWTPGETRRREDSMGGHFKPYDVLSNYCAYTFMQLPAYYSIYIIFILGYLRALQKTSETIELSFNFFNHRRWLSVACGFFSVTIRYYTWQIYFNMDHR